MVRTSYSRRVATVSLAMFCMTNATGQQAAGQVDRKGVESTVKLEAVLSGHLTELNGKYKLRVSELTFQPDGFRQRLEVWVAYRPRLKRSM